MVEGLAFWDWMAFSESLELLSQFKLITKPSVDQIQKPDYRISLILFSSFPGICSTAAQKHNQSCWGNWCVHILPVRVPPHSLHLEDQWHWFYHRNNTLHLLFTHSWRTFYKWSACVHESDFLSVHWHIRRRSTGASERYWISYSDIINEWNLPRYILNGSMYLPYYLNHCHFFVRLLAL